MGDINFEKLYHSKLNTSAGERWVDTVGGKRPRSQTGTKSVGLPYYENEQKAIDWNTENVALTKKSKKKKQKKRKSKKRSKKRKSKKRSKKSRRIKRNRKMRGGGGTN